MSPKPGQSRPFGVLPRPVSTGFRSPRGNRFEPSLYSKHLVGRAKEGRILGGLSGRISGETRCSYRSERRGWGRPWGLGVPCGSAARRRRAVGARGDDNGGRGGLHGAGRAGDFRSDPAVLVQPPRRRDPSCARLRRHARPLDRVPRLDRDLCQLGCRRPHSTPPSRRSSSSAPSRSGSPSRTSSVCTRTTRRGPTIRRRTRRSA